MSRAGKDRGWNLEELQILKDKVRPGFDINELCNLLGRSKAAIYGKIQRLDLNIQDIEKEDELIEVCNNIISLLYTGDSKMTACAKYGITRDKFDRCIKRHVILQDKMDEFKYTTFKCYKCSKILKIEQLYYTED